MSALFKKDEREPINKDAEKHFQGLCESTKINADIAYINYPSGWYRYLEDFVGQIKEIPVEFFKIDGSNRQLYIQFKAKFRKDELALYKTTEKLIAETRDACAGCGAYTNGYQITKNEKLCRECYKSAAKSGKTGTWLDSYIKN